MSKKVKIIIIVAIVAIIVSVLIYMNNKKKKADEAARLAATKKGPFRTFAGVTAKPLVKPQAKNPAIMTAVPFEMSPESAPTPGAPLDAGTIPQMGASLQMGG